jgi:ribosomal protein S18 acetylase RimI-like enzyme
VYLAVHNLRLEGIAYLLDIDEAIEALSGTAARGALEKAHDRPHEGEMSYLGIDYITAQYRDLGLAQDLYEQIGRHMEERTVVCLLDDTARRSKRFLSSNGFTPVFTDEVEEPAPGSRRRLVVFARTFVG